MVKECDYKPCVLCWFSYSQGWRINIGGQQIRMAKTRMVNTKFWSDGFVVELNPLDRYLFLYLLTNEHTNISGVYELPLKRMANETGIDTDMLPKMLSRLKGKVVHIEGWVGIKNFQKHQSTTSSSVQKGITIEMEKIPPRIKEKLEKAYGMDRVSGHLIYPNPNLNLNSNPNLNVEASPEYDERFLSFWNKYPKKIGKGDAYRAWKKLKPSVNLTETIIASVEAHANDGQWKREGGRYIPNPATFLNQRRFEDELTLTTSTVIKI